MVREVSILTRGLVGATCARPFGPKTYFLPTRASGTGYPLGVVPGSYAAECQDELPALPLLLLNRIAPEVRATSLA